MVLAVPVWATNLVPGQFETAALLNTIGNNGTFLTDPPDFVGTQNTIQSIAATTWGAIGLDTEQFDSYGGHSTVTNTSRYVAQVTGWYTVCGVVAFSLNGTGARGSRLQVNGTAVAGACSFIPGLSSNSVGVATPTRDLFLNATDYVEVAGWQNSGGALNTTVNSDFSSGLWVRFSHA